MRTSCYLLLVLRGYTLLWLVQLRQTNFKYFSRICRRQITVFKDKYLFNESAFLNRPLLNILLAKSRHGVIYNFYFFVHGWSHYQVYYFPLQTFWRLYKPWLFLLWCFLARTKRNCCLWCKIEFNCAKICKPMKDHERVAVTAEFWPLPVISLLLLKGIILLHLTVWTKLPHNNDNARFAITTLLTWSLKSVMFSLMTVVST